MRLHCAGVITATSKLVFSEVTRGRFISNDRERERERTCGSMYSPAVTNQKDKAMRLHVISQGDKTPQPASQPASQPANIPMATKILIEEQHPYHLITFAYPNDIKLYNIIWQQFPCDIIVDSGAFTAHKLGKLFTVEQYATFIQQFKKDYTKTLNSITFMNLDVINNQEQSWKNFDQLQQNNCNVIPIVTAKDSTLKDVDRACEHEYFAIGGIANAGAVERKHHLDRLFKHIMTKQKLPKIHLLGVTVEWALERYPAYSCDSSSWLSVLRYGNSKLAGLNKVQSYTKGRSEAGAVIETLRKEIKQYQKMQDNTTKLWERRGITWEKNK